MTLTKMAKQTFQLKERKKKKIPSHPSPRVLLRLRQCAFFPLFTPFLLEAMYPIVFNKAVSIVQFTMCSIPVDECCILKS